MEDHSFIQLLQLARDGDAAGTDALLAKYRPLLRVLAARATDPRVQARVDASDVVQLTCFEAHRDLAQFQGASEAEWIGWIRRILDHNVIEERQKHLKARKRSTAREASPPDRQGEPGDWNDLLPAPTSSPSRRAMRSEEAVRLATALEQLPADQAEAVRLRHIEGFTVAELAAHFGRSDTAVAGLLKRGLKKLRQIFTEEGNASGG